MRQLFVALDALDSMRSPNVQHKAAKDCTRAIIDIQAEQPGDNFGDGFG
jgi:hypothetical protein